MQIEFELILLSFTSGVAIGKGGGGGDHPPPFFFKQILYISYIKRLMQKEPF